MLQQLQYGVMPNEEELETAATILEFLREIGLGVRLAEFEGHTFVPGVRLEPGGLVVDLAKLKYPGDLLHEAGHLAVMLPEQRAATDANAGENMGEEIGAQCWSYAAAVHLRLRPEVVFHEHGYHGSAETLIGAYREGSVGVPLLQWMGLTVEAGWPKMQRWLRAE